MSGLSRLKLCFLAGTLEHGGAERQLFYILQALCQAGATPRLLSMDQGEFWEQKIKALGVAVTCIGERGSRLTRLFRLLKEMRNERPDVLQSQHFFTNAYVGLSARLSHSIGIGAMRSDGRNEASDCGLMGAWLNLHSPRMIAANSHTAIRYAMSRGVPASRLYFLPNVVDTEWFRPPGPSPEQSLTMVAVGRVAKEKRLDRFISILHRLRRDFHLNARGLIVGPASQKENIRAELENQARSLGLLPEALEFRGGVSDVRSVYHEADVCVLTSDFEGTPNALSEAMASGLPVVATKVGGVPDIVRHGQTGFLREPHELDRLVTDVLELLKNRELKSAMGRRARCFVEEHHSLQRLPAYLSGLYELSGPKEVSLMDAVVQPTSV